MTKYLVTEGDFNDVFNRTEMEFKDYSEAEKYAKSMFKQEYIDNGEVEDLSSMDSIVYGVYYPVTDDEGNEINENDPKYEELSEQQESRLQYYIDISEIDDTLI